MRGLSTRQRHVLIFARRYIESHGFPPSLREIGAGIGLSGTAECRASNARGHISRLEKKGYVHIASSIARGLTILRDEHGNSIVPVGRRESPGTLIPRGECYDCGAALFGVNVCPMCAQGIGRKAS